MTNSLILDKHRQEEFVRISATLLPPYRYIHSFNGNEVFMKRMPEIADNTQYSSSTMERCLAEFRKEGLVKYKGSKKTGGYHLV